MVVGLDRFPFLGTGNLWTRFLDLESILVGLLSVGLICGRCILWKWTLSDFPNLCLDCWLVGFSNLSVY